MFTSAERAQLRAALILWQETAKNSRTHPADIPACKVIFIMEDTLPLSDEKLEVLMDALEHGGTFLSVPAASVLYEVPKHRLRRELKRMEQWPVAGTRLFSKGVIVHAVARIRRRDGS